MTDLPDTYSLETIEQVRALADDLRLRIVNQLTAKPMTVTQLGAVLGVAPSKLHYHVHELEKVGLLQLVETREKGGILEKYYRSVAKTINAPGSLFQGVQPDELVTMLTGAIQPFFQGMIQVTQEAVRTQAWNDPDQVLLLSPDYYWMTADEFRQVGAQIDALIAPYKAPRGIEREREQAILFMGYTLPPARSQEEEPSAPATPAAVPEPPARPAAVKPAKKPWRGVNIVAGAVHYSRKDLEKMLAEGEAMNMYIVGACAFADDVTPDLIDRAIYSFHHWGKLIASPEVREVLKRKGGEAGSKSSAF